MWPPIYDLYDTLPMLIVFISIPSIHNVIFILRTGYKHRQSSPCQSSKLQITYSIDSYGPLGHDLTNAHDNHMSSLRASYVLGIGRPRACRTTTMFVPQALSANFVQCERTVIVIIIFHCSSSFPPSLLPSYFRYSLLFLFSLLSFIYLFTISQCKM